MEKVSVALVDIHIDIFPWNVALPEPSLQVLILFR